MPQMPRACTYKGGREGGGEGWRGEERGEKFLRRNAGRKGGREGGRMGGKEGEGAVSEAGLDYLGGTTRLYLHLYLQAPPRKQLHPPSLPLSFLPPSLPG